MSTTAAETAITRARTVVVLGLVAVLSLVACSSSGKKTTTTTSLSPLTTTRPTKTFTGEGSGPFCDFANSFINGFTGSKPGASTAEIQANVQAADKAIHQAVDVAPGEIKPDVKVIADGFSAVAALLAESNYDLTKLVSGELSSKLPPGFSDATSNLTAYMTQFCGVPK